MIVADTDVHAYATVEAAYVVGARSGGETKDAYAADARPDSATGSEVEAILAAARQLAWVRARTRELLVLRNRGFFDGLHEKGFVDQDSEEDTYANLPDLLHPDDFSLASTEPESDSESKSDSEWGLGGNSAQC